MRLPVLQTGVIRNDGLRQRQVQSMRPSGVCGSGWNEPWIRDSYGGADFTAACRNHDACYDACGRSKDDCDSTFLRELHSECNSTYSSPWHAVQLRLCKETANTYHSAVHRMGGDAYRAAQSANGCS